MRRRTVRDPLFPVHSGISVRIRYFRPTDLTRGNMRCTCSTCLLLIVLFLLWILVIDFYPHLTFSCSRPLCLAHIHLRALRRSALDLMPSCADPNVLSSSWTSSIIPDNVESECSATLIGFQIRIFVALKGCVRSPSIKISRTLRYICSVREA
jgi:hypothetical protein